jgi:putative DNA primase/helicase
MSKITDVVLPSDGKKNDPADFPDDPDYLDKIETAQPPGATDEDRILTCAGIDPLEYDRNRKQFAEEMGVSVGALDTAVKAARRASKEGAAKGRELSFYEPEPWHEPVNGAEALTEAADHILRHMAISKGDAYACAVWAAHTYMFELFDHTPRLCVTAQTEEAGKTVLMAHMVGNLVNKPQPVELMKAAPFFRIAEDHHPTFLIDECDVFIREDSDLLSALNNGWEPHGGVPRCVGDDNEVRIFSTHAPTAMAGIQLMKKLPPTTIGRSIVINLIRAIDGEVPVPYSKAIHQAGLRETGRKLARFIADNSLEIASCNPVMPDYVRNRLADKWTPLFAIAEIAGDGWPAKLETALYNQANIAEPTRAMQLLQDIKMVAIPGSHAFTETLIDKLCEMDDAPWADYNFKQWESDKKKISSTQLSNLLKNWELKPTLVRVSGAVKRGYKWKHLDKAFARYLSISPESPESGRYTLQPNKNAALSASSDVTPENDVTPAESLKPLQGAGCNSVTGKTPFDPEKEEKEVIF